MSAESVGKPFENDGFQSESSDKTMAKAASLKPPTAKKRGTAATLSVESLDDDVEMTDV